MPERGATEIRQEMAAARTRLEESRTLLLAEVRSFAPVVVVGLVAVGLAIGVKGVLGGLRMIGKLT